MAVFCLLSGQGTDQTQTSKVAFARCKGEAENRLKDMGFPALHLFRPGTIYPVEPRKEPNWMYRLFRALYPLLHRLFPKASITSDQLGWAMVDVALHGRRDFRNPELENEDILRLVDLYMA